MKIFDIIKKIKVLKQKKCVRAINYVTDINNLNIYKSGNRIIENCCYVGYIQKKEYTLDDIKEVYINNLEKKKKYYLSYNKKTVDDILIYMAVKDDIRIIQKLDYNFINVYNKVEESIIYIEKNKQYLSDEQKDKYLSKYYKYTNIENGEMKKLVRTVK